MNSKFSELRYMLVVLINDFRQMLADCMHSPHGSQSHSRSLVGKSKVPYAWEYLLEVGTNFTVTCCWNHSCQSRKAYQALSPILLVGHLFLEKSSSRFPDSFTYADAHFMQERACSFHDCPSFIISCFGKLTLVVLQLSHI